MLEPHTIAQRAVQSSAHLLRHACVALGALLLASGPVQASNLGFLGKAPISRFNEADLDLLRGALGKALASEKMDVEFSWANPKTGASGVITPLRALDKDGAPCREVRAVSRHPQTAPADGVFLLCQRDGRWKMIAKVS